jgi:predicted kinase
VAELAADTFTDLTELRCLLPANVAADRLRRRGAESPDASDATPPIASRMAEVFDPWPSAAIVGTLPPVEDILPAVLERLAAPTRRQRRAVGAAGR